MHDSSIIAPVIPQVNETNNNAVTRKSPLSMSLPISVGWVYNLLLLSWIPPCAPDSSVIELAVGVLPKQGLTHCWQGTLPKKPQPRFKSVVEIDLAPCSNNDNTTSTREYQTSVSILLPFQL